jgi:hypothetical protein
LTTGTMTFTQAEELATRLNAGAEPDLSVPSENAEIANVEMVLD